MNVVFINSAPAKCSIHESGRMVADSLVGSDRYMFTYTTVDELDPAALSEGRIAWAEGIMKEPFGRIDAVVVNWHIVTMPLSDDSISLLPGFKMAIVLEAAPGDPLALTPVKSFDAYLVLDPTVPETEKVWAFPRPLSFAAFKRRTTPNEIVRIGSFGFGTPGKGFELVVEAVNREFDRAEIVINIPSGDFISTDSIHDESYVQHIERTLKAIAKPGVTVDVTSNFFSPVELIEWCDANDLNCFMYTREQPGLAATTDQAIICGRPLLTISNPTFRHITRYLTPYPRQSLRDAIAHSTSAVQTMQKTWSPAAFRGKFEQVLDQNATVRGGMAADATAMPQQAVVVTLGMRATDDIYAYSTRFVAALNRSGEFDAENIDGENVASLLVDLLARRPKLIVLIGEGAVRRAFAASARAFLPQSRVIEAGWELSGDDHGVFQLRPIIPFYTVQRPLAEDPAVVMIGFGNEKHAAMRALRALARDDPEALIFIDCPALQIAGMRDFIGDAKMHSRALSRLRIDFLELPKRALTLIDFLASQRAVVAQVDRNDPRDLENKLSLAYVTERPILISTDRPVRFFKDGTGTLGGLDLRVIERCGVASRISTVMDYGEWTFVEAFRGHLDRHLATEADNASPYTEAVDAAVFGLLTWDSVSTGHGAAQSGSNEASQRRAIRHLLADIGGMLEGTDRVFVTRMYRMILRREPDPGGLNDNIAVLERGVSRPGVIAAFLTSPERKQNKGLSPYWERFPNVLLEFPSIPLLIGWLDGLVALNDEQFSAELRRLREQLGYPALGCKTENSSDRIIAVLELAEATCADRSDPDFAASRTQLWSRLCDRMESGDAGILHEVPALPAREHETAIRLPSSRDCGDRLELTAFGLPRQAINIFGQPQPSRLFNAVEATPVEIRAVYLLVQADGGAPPDYAADLVQYWPQGIVALHRVAWNRDKRQLELIDERQQRVEIPSFCDRGCAVLAIAGDLLNGEPMGDIAPISEARRRGWRVAALAEAASIAAGAGGNPAAGRTARYWRALSLADEIIATSALAGRTIRRFLAAEVAEADIPAISTVSDLEAQRDKAGFAVRIATRLVALAGGSRVRSFVLYRTAAPDTAAAWIADLRELGMTVTEWTGDAPPPLPIGLGDDVPRWVLADGVAGVADLTQMRSAAVEFGAKAVYLGPVPSIAGDLRSELVHWDLVVVTRLADFRALTRSLRKTRQRVCDAEGRFVLLDHPAEWLPPLAIGQRAGDDDLRVAIPRGLTSRPSVVDPGGHPVELVEVDGEGTSWFGQERRIDAFLAIGPSGYVGPMVEAAARNGVPALIQNTADALLTPGFIPLLAKSDNGDFTVPDAQAMAQAAEELRLWTVRNRQDAVRELAACLARAESPRRAALKPRAAPMRSERSGRPLLSLCISTYNRAGWVALNLRNIYQQIDANDHDIEVLVVDNCSTDNTREICATFEHHPNFRVLRNDVNVGMLGNLSVTAQYATGDYLWVIGDDDLTREGVIANVCTILRQDPSLDLIYLNYGYTSIADPTTVGNPKDVTENFNILEPAGLDRRGTVAELAAGSENFYTAIYAIVYRREHGFRAYCQDTSARPFSSLVTCVPTAQYALAEMGRCAAYWIGEPALVVNSNVSWQAYGPLFDLEQLPRVWDLAEISGADPAAVDRRRASRLWLVEMMWRDMFLADTIGNQAYFDPMRVLMRLKHLPELDSRIPALREIYEVAYRQNQPAARLPPEHLFEAWAD